MIRNKKVYNGSPEIKFRDNNNRKLNFKNN